MAEAKIENEIAQIRAQIRALTRRSSTLSAALLSKQSSQPLLPSLTTDAPSPPSTSPPTIADTSPFLTTALTLSKTHTQHALESLYRLSAGCTMFEILDPNPYAIDNGRVFGIRIEVFSSGNFLSPYYIFLTRHPHFRIHKHTLPPSIPVGQLAAQYLPTPPSAKRPQRLPVLVRALRNALTAYHLRVSAISHLQRSVKAGQVRGRGVKSVQGLGEDGREIQISWTDGRMGRLRVGENGDVERVVVVGAGGRDREVERIIMGGDAGGSRVEALGDVLMET